MFSFGENSGKICIWLLKTVKCTIAYLIYLNPDKRCYIAFIKLSQ